MAWAVVADVKRKIPYVTISASGTKPTESQVTDEIAEREAKLKSAMVRGGFSLTQTDSDASAYLKALVVTGTAGWALGLRVRHGQGGQQSETYRDYLDEWKEEIAAIRAGQNVIPGGVKVDGGPPDEGRGKPDSTFTDGTITEPDSDDDYWFPIDKEW